MASGCKRWFSPILFLVLAVAFGVTGLVLVVLWEFPTSRRFAPVWWVGIGFVVACVFSLLVDIALWIWACCCVNSNE